MANCYVKAYFDWIEQTAALSDAERGRLFVGVLEYARTGTLPELGGRESILFPVFKAQIDRETQISTVRSEAGKNGAEAKFSKVKQTQANVSKLANKEKEKEEEKYKDKENEKESVKKRAPAFVPPTVEEVKAYCSERKNGIDAEAFVAYYENRGWKVGSAKMKDWHLAVVTWEKKDWNKKQTMTKASMDYGDPTDKVERMKRMLGSMGGTA